MKVFTKEDLLKLNDGDEGLVEYEYDESFVKSLSPFGITELHLGDAHMFANMTKYLIFQSQAKYCNFDKTISFDITGLNSNLVCSFKRN